MRRFLICISIALITFMVGTIPAALISSLRDDAESNPGRSEAARLVEETDIIGVVFRHQIEHGYSPEQTGYYLSCYNYSDPPEKVMAYLSKNGLRAKALSQVQYDSSIPYDSARIFLRVGSIKWVSDTEVMVGGSARSSDWSIHYGTRAYIYRLVREEQGWTVVSTETIS